MTRGGLHDAATAPLPRFHGPYRAEHPATWLPDWSARQDCLEAFERMYREGQDLLAAPSVWRERWEAEHATPAMRAADLAREDAERTGWTECPLCRLSHRTGADCPRCGPVIRPDAAGMVDLGELIGRLTEGDGGRREVRLFDELLDEVSNG